METESEGEEMKKAARCALCICLLLLAVTSAWARVQNNLSLQGVISVPGAHFLGPQTIVLDGNNVYTASDTAVHVVNVKSLKVTSYPLPSGNPTAIAWCDAKQTVLCVTSNAGQLYRLATSKKGTLSLVGTMTLAGYGLTSIGQAGSAAYVGVGSTSVAATSSYIVMSALNSGDYVQKVTGSSLGMTYGQDLLAFTIRAFVRSTGAQVATWDNPTDLRGNLAAAALFSSPDGRLVATTAPGCCGRGISIFGLTTNPPVLKATVDRPYADSVCFAGKYLFVGGEEGGIDVWSLADPANPQRLTGISLNASIRASQIDAAEVRSLTCAPSGKSFILFGATSSTYGSSYPNFFKLIFTPK